MDAVRAAVPAGFIVTSRVNIFDGFPYPYGFGVNDREGVTPDLTEPLRLLDDLKLPIVNITIGNPYQNPQVNRPTNIEGVERIISLTGKVQSAFPQTAVIASGPTFLREQAGSFAAGAIEQNYCTAMGFGRMAFAYPDFAKNILSDQFDKSKACITCGNCSKLMRVGSVTGCCVRDDYYRLLFKKIFSNQEA